MESSDCEQNHSHFTKNKNIDQIKVNLTYPYRKISKNKPNRSHFLFLMLQMILCLTGKVINSYKINHPGKEYETPFSDKNILNIFSSENI